MLLVTGGCGFIGANFILGWLATSAEPVVNLDALTYAGNPENLASLRGDSRHHFVHANICDTEALARVFSEFAPRAVLHFAAESHVDRSICGPAAFVETNVQGTLSLLEAARRHVDAAPAPLRSDFRFLHVSTDEVYGSLEPQAAPFTEASPIAPNSPYAASKAGSDHLVRAYFKTFGLATLTTHASNNFGPYQFPEKLIPLAINNALNGRAIPIYGNGKQVRDWIHVGDHCSALRAALVNGRPGEVYNIGGSNERENLEVVKVLCAILDRLRPKAAGSYFDQVEFVKDRLGHDTRYAIDSRKAESALGWKPEKRFEDALEDTVRWYLDNAAWLERVRSGAYLQWIKEQYGT
jgi:dTDP-glucose 4,6-dehydratase